MKTKNQFLKWTLLLLVNCSLSLQVYAQNLYQPFHGTNVQVATVSSQGGLCVNELCLGPGITNLAKIIDGNTSTYADATSLANVLNFGGVSVRDNGQVFPAGYVTGFLFSSHAVLNLDLLNSIVVSTYNNGILQETKTAGNLVGANVVSNDKKQVYLTFITTKSFDEVRFRTVGLSVDALSKLRIYTAFAFPSSSTNPLPISSLCDRPMGGINTQVNFNSEGVCVGCGLDNPERIIDGNASNYANFVATASLVSAPSVGVMNTATVYPTGYRAGFVIGPNSGNALASISLLNHVILETYLFGEKQEVISTAFNPGGGLLSLKLVTYGGQQRNKIGFTSSKPFNEVRLKVDPGAHVSLGAIRVYYAFAEPGTCTDCRQYLGSSSAGKYKGELVSNNLLNVYTGTYGLGAHSLSLTNNVVSSSTSDFSTYTSLLQLLGAGARVTVKNDGTAFAAGTQAGFDVMQEGGLLNLSLLDNIIVRTYLITGNTITLQEEKLGGVSLLGLTVIGDNAQRASVGFKTSKPFNAIQIDINGGLVGLDLGGKTKIYGAFVFEDADEDGYGDCIDLCATGDDAIDTDFDGIPDACDVCQAGDVAPELPVYHLINNCFDTNQLAVHLPAPLVLVPATVFEYHTALPASPANKFSLSTLSDTGSYTFYGVFYDSIHDCYSPSVTLTVLISSCEIPDITAEIIYGSDVLMGTIPAQFAIKIKNITNSYTTGPIRFKLSRTTRTIVLPYDTSLTSVSIPFNGIPTVLAVNNADWTDSQINFYESYYTTSIVLPPYGESVVGIDFHQNPANFNNDVIFVYVTDFTGGEQNVANNITSQLLLYDQPFVNERPLMTTIESGNNITIYPNPVQSTLTIDGLNQDDLVEVFNVLGQKIFVLQHPDSTSFIATDDLSAGVYTLVVTTGLNNKLTYKFIKSIH